MYGPIVPSPPPPRKKHPETVSSSPSSLLLLYVPRNTRLISAFCTGVSVGKEMLNLTLRLPLVSGFFCRGMPSPRMTLTVPGVTWGSVTYRWVGGWMDEWRRKRRFE